MSCLVEVINSLAIKKHTASIGLCETVKHLEVFGGGVETHKDWSFVP